MSSIFCVLVCKRSVAVGHVERVVEPLCFFINVGTHDNQERGITMKNFLSRASRILAVVFVGFGCSLSQAASSDYTFTGYIPANGLSISGSVSIETSSTLWTGDWGVEGTTIPGLVSLTLSDGNTVSALRNWYSKDFGSTYLLASRGEAGVSIVDSNIISAYRSPEPAFFSLSGLGFGGLMFFLPTSLPTTFLSSDTPLNFSGISGQININNVGYAIHNLNIAAVPEPETYAMLLAGLGLIGFVARHKKQKLSA